ncbi:MAG: hypothetical protein ABIR71_01105 [Chthoniobacterales bacterium]
MPKIGTLRLSAPPNQMRKVQKTACREWRENGRETSATPYDTGSAKSWCSNTVASGATMENTSGLVGAGVSEFVGFCLGRMHDFIVAQQSLQDMPTTGWPIAQLGVDARNGAKKSARTSRRPAVCRRAMGYL